MNLEVPLVKHFVDNGHSSSELRFLILETIKKKKYDHSNILDILAKKESAYIFRLNTLMPSGLNTSLELNAFFCKKFHEQL